MSALWLQLFVGIAVFAIAVRWFVGEIRAARQLRADIEHDIAQIRQARRVLQQALDQQK